MPHVQSNDMVGTNCCLIQVREVQFNSNIFKLAYLSFIRRKKGFDTQNKQTQGLLRAGQKDPMIDEAQISFLSFCLFS